jgi:hypothetical protein
MKPILLLSLPIFAVLLASSGCEITTTCEGHDCEHSTPQPSCTFVTGGERDASPADAYVSVADASGTSVTPDASTADASAIDTGTYDAGAQPQADSGQPGAMCRVNGDCAINEDCIGGGCFTRCKASCQCRLGEACLDGYCSIAPPPQSCTTDCDCLAGQSCVESICQ